MFDPLIEQAEKQIDELKKAPGYEVETGQMPAKRDFRSVIRLERKTLSPKGGEQAGSRADTNRPAFDVAEGLEVNLYAESPLLAKPIQMNFDPQGRLWIATSSVYPQIQPGEVSGHKI